MGEENRSLLEEEIKAEIKRLGSLESGSQEHTTAVDSLTKLYKTVSRVVDGKVVTMYKDELEKILYKDLYSHLGLQFGG